MSSPSPTLNQLPPEILNRIAAYATERGIWAMMGTCRLLRRAVERDLEPYLRERVVIVDRDRAQQEGYFQARKFKASSVNVGREEGPLSHQALRAVTAIFDQHLAAYPKAVRELRSLTIELSDVYYAVGWSQLLRVAPSLRELEIRLDDRSWQSAAPVGRLPFHVDTDNDDQPPRPAPLDTFHKLRQGFETTSPLFHNLTMLIVDSYHPFKLFTQLGQLMPQLRDLTLSSRYRESDPRWPGPLSANADFDTIKELPHLQRLCLDVTAIDNVKVLGAFTLNSPKLQNVIMVAPPAQADDLIRSGPPALVPGELAQLALFDGSSLDYYLRGRMSRNPLAQPAISTLVSERRNRYDLLDPPHHDWLALPVLERLTWVEREGAPGTPMLRSLRDARLKDLFDRYPTLQQVCCLATYPADPFADHNLSGTDDNVLFYANRSDICG